MNTLTRSVEGPDSHPEPVIAPDQTHCRACGRDEMTLFYEANNVPIHSCLLLQTREEALSFPRGRIALGFCEACGFIGNTAFDDSIMRYSSAYEEQQSFSPRFNLFATELATRLIQDYKLQGKQIIEIGCGKGDFLELLCEMGNNHGIGIDPSYIPGRLPGTADERVTFISDFYSESYGRLQADMVCCRHTLEHIPETRAFVETVRRGVGEQLKTVVFFELPDVHRVLEEGAFWDIYYEHCSYFTLGSLARLFQSCGFSVIHLAKAFDDQYLLLEALPVQPGKEAKLPPVDGVADTAAAVDQFVQAYKSTRDLWVGRFDSFRRTGKKAAIWGSGSKCVAFLATLGLQDEVEFVVDINPHRHGRYLAGSGKQICGPESLRDYRPDVVVAMNPIYCDEIRRGLDEMGIHPELMAV